jgi:hypothetical protein
MHMSGKLFAVSLFIALAAHQPARAECEGLPPAPPPVAANTPQMRAAQELAGLYVPRALIMTQLDQEVRRGIVESIDEDAALRTRVEQNPNELSQFITIAQVVTRECMEVAIPTLEAETARIFAQNLSVENMRSLIGFYRSPIGQHLMRSVMTDDAAYTPRLDANGNLVPLTTAQLRSELRQPVENALAGLSPEQMRELEAFGRSPAGISLTRLSPVLNRAVVNTVNAAMVALMQTLTNRVEREMPGFLTR